MKIDESKRQKLEIELTKLHNEITSLSENYYDVSNERVRIDYPKIQKVVRWNRCTMRYSKIY